MEADRQKRLAANIRYLRAIYGYTQSEIADILHISRSTYALLENGKAVPSTDTIFALADFYQIQVELLMPSKANPAISQLAALSQKNKSVIKLINTYFQLSPHGRGRLIERAEALLEAE